MQVYFVRDLYGKRWDGLPLFNAEDIQPQTWGFQPFPSLTTAVHHVEEEGKTLYRLEARAYRHTQNNTVLLLLDLQRQGEGQETIEEKAAIIFGRVGDMDIIPEVLHTLRPGRLGDLITQPRDFPPSGVSTGMGKATTVVHTAGVVWTRGSADDRVWGTTHAHAATTD